MCGGQINVLTMITMIQSHLGAVKRSAKYLSFAVVTSLLLITTSIGAVHAAEPLQAEALFDENDFMIFGVKIVKERIPSEVTGYRYKDSYVLSLYELASALEFAIGVKAEEGTASGWFIKEERKFSLDYAKHQVSVDGRELLLAKEAAYIHNGELYVSIEALSDWFPVELGVNITDLILEVAPREYLPVQARLDRAKRQSLIAHSGVAQVTMPYKDMPYQSYSAPVVDLGLNYSIINRKGYDPTINYSYNINANGDMANMTTHIQAAGSKGDSLGYLMLDMERVDFEDGMFGPLGVNVVKVGDIRTATMASQSAAWYERGIFLQKTRDIGVDLYDTVDIDGVLLEGWEVELYRDGLNLGYYTDSGDGRFLFEDIELLYGINQFELVFYGPNGQVERKTRNYIVGQNMLRPLEVGYRLSVTQKETSMFDVSDVASPTTTTNVGSGRLVGSFDVGLSRSLSATVGIHSVEFNDQRHNYSSYGMRASINNLFVSAIHTQDELSGYQDSFFFSSSLSGWRLRGNYIRYNGMISEGNWDSTDPQVSKASVTLLRRFDKVPLSFSYSNVRSEATTSTSLSNTIGYSAGRTSYTHTLSHKIVEDTNGTSDVTSGSANFTTSTYYPLTLRGRLFYEMLPTSAIREYYLGAQLRASNKIGMKFDVTHTPSDVSDYTKFRAGLTWILPNYYLTASLTADSEDTYTGFVTASTSLHKHSKDKAWKADAMASSSYGSVLSRVYIDNNGDGHYNSGDTLYSGAVIKAVQVNKKSDTDESGIAVIRRLQAYRKVDIAVDKTSLSDAALVPASKGHSILPRPGYMAELEFPLVWAGEVEGTLYQQTEQGIETPLASYKLRLVDRDGNDVLSAISAFDGYYLFPEVLPGLYRLALPKDSNREIIAGGGLIEVRGDGSIVGVDKVVLSSEKRSTENAVFFSTGDAGAVVTVPLSQPALQPTDEVTVEIPTSEPSLQAPVDIKAKPVANSGPRGILQLASYRSHDNAMSGRSRLLSQHAKLMSPYQVKIVQGADGLYKLRIEFAEGMAKARNACSTLKKSGIDCFVIK